MTTLLFLCLAVFEIFLFNLTIKKQNEKRDWLRNNIFLKMAELTLFLVVFFPFVKFKWRYYFFSAVLLLRLIIAILIFIVKNKNVSGNKSSFATGLSTVTSLMLTAFSLLPAWLFTDYHGLPTTGKYDVMELDAILVDESRKDSFESDGSFREIPVHFYYPDASDGSFPLVVFSHGAFGYYNSNYSTCAELASNGYIVASLDYPHHSLFTKDTDGKMIIADINFIKNVMSATNDELSEEENFRLSSEWIKLRTDDGNFFLNSLISAVETDKLDEIWHSSNKQAIMHILDITDIEKIGLMGHSLGGAESVQLGRERSDIDAVIDIDGTMFGEIISYNGSEYIYNDAPYPIPVLEFNNSVTHEYLEKNIEDNSDFTYENMYMMDRAVDGRSVWFSNTDHMNFTDLPLMSPFLAKVLGTGSVEAEECIKTMNGIVLDFFDYYLKGKEELNIQDNY